VEKNEGANVQTGKCTTDKSRTGNYIDEIKYYLKVYVNA